MFLRKEKRHSDEPESDEQGPTFIHPESCRKLWQSNLILWENRSRKITWFAQNHLITKCSSAFCKTNLLLNLVGKFKNPTCPKTSVGLFPPYPEMKKKTARLEAWKDRWQTQKQEPIVWPVLGAAPVIQARAQGSVGSRRWALSARESGPPQCWASEQAASFSSLETCALSAPWHPEVTGLSQLG